MCSANLDVFGFTMDDADRSAIAAMDCGHPIIWDHGSVKVGMGLFDLIANVQLQGSKLYWFAPVSR